MAKVCELKPHQSLPEGPLLLIQRRSGDGADIGYYGGGIKAVNLSPDAADSDFDREIEERQAEADREGLTICVIREFG
jgi:hypothetical protein